MLNARLTGRAGSEASNSGIILTFIFKFVKNPNTGL